MMMMISVGPMVGRKLGYQAFAGCMRSHLTPGWTHQQMILIVIIIVIIVIKAPDPWECFTPVHAGPHYVLEQDIPQIRGRQYLTQMD